ncbi:MAG: DUF3306 domain-containing protein [Bacteroidota bacterium]
MTGGFLTRWSRLKTESKTEEPVAPVAEDAPAPEPEQPPPPPDLPPLDSLTKDSDFSAFLQAGVPEDLRRAALSKLWASDPLFTQPEVFDLHMEDYNAHPLGEGIKTAWKLGKGIVEDIADGSEAASFPQSPENMQSNTKDDEKDTPTS